MVNCGLIKQFQKSGNFKRSGDIERIVWGRISSAWFHRLPWKSFVQNSSMSGHRYGAERLLTLWLKEKLSMTLVNFQGWKNHYKRLFLSLVKSLWERQTKKNTILHQVQRHVNRRRLIEAWWIQTSFKIAMRHPYLSINFSILDSKTTTDKPFGRGLLSNKGMSYSLKDFSRNKSAIGWVKRKYKNIDVSGRFVRKAFICLKS